MSDSINVITQLIIVFAWLSAMSDISQGSVPTHIARFLVKCYLDSDSERILKIG